MAAIDHLAVLIHGLWGAPVHLEHLRDTLQQEHGDDGLEILIPKSNSNNFTYDGIEVGAERITHEIESRIRELEQSGSKITKLSITGYSLGGLVARFVVGILYKNGIFDTIQPVNFTTFATPHLGVKTPTRGYSTEVWNWLGSKTLSTSGQQMFLVDDFRGTGRHLLDIMADPNSTFVAGLRLFKHRTLYANTMNDRSVPFYTACISKTDPFADLDMIETHNLPRSTVLLDPSQPVTRLSERRPPPPSTGLISPATRKALPFYAVFFTLMPIAIPVFLLNAGYQTYRSAQRVRLHETGSTLDLSRYRFPLLLEEQAQQMQDKLVERLESTTSREEYLPTPPPERNTIAPTTQEGDDEKRTMDWEKDFPVLALSKEQFAMVDNLNKVGFVKYPAHIVNVRHTHAAIVVRTAKPDFDEGREVVKHWAVQFEV